MNQLDFGTLTDTLREEQDRIKSLREGDGCHCKACGQFCKVYKRPIHASMAVALIYFGRMVNFDCSVWVHTDMMLAFNSHFRAALKGGDFAKLSIWGLIEELPVDEKENIVGRTTGTWRLTELGVQFIKKQKFVSSHVYIYDNKILGFTDDMVDIGWSIRKKFNYNELMGLP